MANSVDPDQTAPEGAVWSWSTLLAYAILQGTLVYEILGNLPYCDNSSFISSPEHKVLKVSYCDQSMSVVPRASSALCRAESINLL